jgi:predicted lipoprotein with Yx(FWY)xxD motif
MDRVEPRNTRRMGLISAAAIVALALAACAKSATPASGASSSPPASTKTVAVSTASVGSMGTVLVNSSGMTLYYLKSEKPGSISCTGTCATNWPPLLLPAGVMSATAGSGVNAGDLGTIKRPDGSTQVTYKGRALYLFVGDHSAGQATGQGVEDFFAVTPSGSTSSGGSSPSSGGGGYGY